MPLTQPQTAQEKRTFSLILPTRTDQQLQAGRGNIWRTCCVSFGLKVVSPKCSDDRWLGSNPLLREHLLKIHEKHLLSSMIHPPSTVPLCSPLDVAAPQFSKTKSAFLPHVRNKCNPFNLKDLWEEGVEDWDRSTWGNCAWSSDSCCEWSRLGRGRLAVNSKTLCGSLLLSSDFLSLPMHLSQTYRCAIILFFFFF